MEIKLDSYSHLTNDELLREVYAPRASDKLLQELAKRLERAQEEIDVLKANLND